MAFISNNNKGNPNHDENGRFTSGNNAKAPGGNKNEEKQAMKLFGLSNSMPVESIERKTPNVLRELSKRKDLKLTKYGKGVVVGAKDKVYYLTKNNNGNFDLSTMDGQKLKENVSAEKILKIFPNSNNDFGEEEIKEYESHKQIPENWQTMSDEEKDEWRDTAAKYFNINILDDSEFNN